MIGIFLSGWSGRMGASIRELVEENPTEFGLIAGRSGSTQVNEARVHKDLPMSKPEGVDVVIDFSLPVGFAGLVQWCVDQKLPLVSGTTGLNEEHMSALEAAAEKIPVLWAPNMSLGVAVLTESLKVLGLLKGADFQIEEFHHNKKIDKPSGTALWLQEALGKVVATDLPEPLAVRGGGIFGIHRVHAMTDEETLTFEHQALNRKVFARGALVAAKWLSGQGPGRYQMADVLLTEK